jgi:superfamily II DNA or RNA helicase
LTSAAQVRARIANLILGERPVDIPLGDVELHPHQLSAVSRVRSSIREFGGALLCDEVGMGKTFVAAAIARECSAPLVVAPAALAEMWRDALVATDTPADFISFEKLSRLPAPSPPRQSVTTARPPGLTSERKYDLVIVDEAHHARNHATRRHARLKALTRDAKVVLLSATPIHNRRAEMSAVLSLFLGSRASALTPAEIARCVLRRGHSQLRNHALIPRVLPVRTLRVSDNPTVVHDLISLPDPVPVRDGGSGGVLIGRGLVHQWASSEAALHAALRRRIARAWALIASLEAGTYPSEQELRAWTFDDGALQLGFPELLSARVGDTHALLNSVRRHASALDTFRAQHSRQSRLDDERARHLLAIRRSHPGTKIVAFSQYAPTVSMFYRELQNIGGVAILTSQGARVAGGKLSRRDALARFAPAALKTSRPPPTEAIELLLTTDLLSEGVNLQDAQIIVHLDLPWTAARMEQRVGRVARMGSPHTAIHMYLFRPPESADALLATESLITRKWDIARRVVGSSASSPLANSEQSRENSQSMSQLTESLRAILESWRYSESTAGEPNPLPSHDDICVAAVESRESGFLAALELGEEPQLVVSISGDISTDVESQISACKLGLGADVDATCDDVEQAVATIRTWAERESASAIAGISVSKSLNRRRLITRIDRAIESAHPHSRSSRITIAAHARAVVASQQSAAIETELALLADSNLADDEWLQAIARIRPTNHPTRQRAKENNLTIRALLLLCAPRGGIRVTE